MVRETKSVKMHPLAVEAVKERARKLNASFSYVIEMCVAHTLPEYLPENFIAGIRIQQGDDND